MCVQVLKHSSSFPENAQTEIEWRAGQVQFGWFCGEGCVVGVAGHWGSTSVEKVVKMDTNS